jgi:lipopolysaccharide transport system permease protein
LGLPRLPGNCMKDALITPPALAVRLDPLAITPSVEETVIRPSRGWASLNLGELWRYRELLFFLMWRDIKVRYTQTVLGIAWAFIQPFFTMVVFSLFFGRLGGMDQRTGDIPYPLYTFAALLPWTFFAFALAQSADSLVANANLIKKVYFPRLMIPLASVSAGVADFAVAFLTLLVMQACYATAGESVLPTWRVVFLPLFFLLALITSLGVGLWLSALNIQFRDVRYTLGFLTQLWLFLTPIAYPASIVPERWQAVYGLNPMVGVVEGFRWALLGAGDGPGVMLAVSTAASAVLFVSGLYYFRRMERTFADLA